MVTKVKKVGGSEVPGSADAHSRSKFSPSIISEWLNGLKNLFVPASSDVVNNPGIDVLTKSENKSNMPKYKLLEKSILEKESLRSVRNPSVQVPGSDEAYLANDHIPQHVIPIDNGIYAGSTLYGGKKGVSKKKSLKKKKGKKVNTKSKSKKK